MIIKNVKAKKFSVQDKKSIRFIFKTSNGKFKTKVGLYSDNLYSKEELDNDINFVNKILNEKIKNIEINDFKDLKIIEDLIKKENPNIKTSTLLGIEECILRAISKDQLWQYLDKNIKQVPRPVGVIFGKSDIKQSTDFKQILLFSFQSTNFTKAIDANSRVHELLEREIKKYDKSFKGEINFDGAFIANISNYDILDILNRICKQVSAEFKFELKMGVNFDADSYFKDGLYQYKNYSSAEKEKILTKKDQIKFVIDLVNRYNLCYIEDPLEKTDFKGFNQIKKKTTSLVCGNKLISNNLGNLNLAIKNGSINTLLLSLNKIGSLLQAKSLIEEAKKGKIYVITETSHYETDDNFIVHFAVAFNLPVLKYGIYRKDKDKIEEIKKIEKLMKIK